MFSFLIFQIPKRVEIFPLELSLPVATFAKININSRRVCLLGKWALRHPNGIRSIYNNSSYFNVSFFYCVTAELSVLEFTIQRDDIIRGIIRVAIVFSRPLRNEEVGNSILLAGTLLGCKNIPFPSGSGGEPWLKREKRKGRPAWPTKFTRNGVTRGKSRRPAATLVSHEPQI